MRGEVVPEADLLVEIFILDVFERPEVEEELVAVLLLPFERLDVFGVGAGRFWPKVLKKANARLRLKAPWRCMSSQNQSAIGACGETALSAGWASIALIAA